ncbi:MAG: trypsin-like serine protease [Desulfuromonadaceae bacterium]|nr:trypsin-like serine protease [Desulfuromonadaceae bacterium]MDD5106506.1 trypsin-like serine protease [Desulfuromonadaceae bacterium]
MIVSNTSYLNNQIRALPGEGFDGVVRISTGGHYGSGALLFDGQAILTAAHTLTTSPGVAATSASVYFETVEGTVSVTATNISVIPSYDPINDNNDLALIWLPSSAAVKADRYDIYRNSNEIGQSLTLAGYGAPGSGNSGVDAQYTGVPLRIKGENLADADAGTLKAKLGGVMGWSPTPGTQLVSDFDNGSTAQDALGRLIGNIDPGLGTKEGMITPGDSGGPAFIDGHVAGIASYTASMSTRASHPDLDNTSNSSFGELEFWQRVSAYQQWIDQSLRSHYPDAPATPEDVQKVITEGNSGTSYVYFLVQYNGERTTPDALLSIDYSTRNGSAVSGSDYISASGTLRLYPGENQAVIPVELIGDTIPEPTEVFYLDVTNPVGGTFADNATTLTAMRTILDNDGWIL